MRNATIPIQGEQHCSGTPVFRLVEPQLRGQPEHVRRIVDTLKPLVDAEFGADTPPAAWLRSLSLADGEVQMTLAPELACRGHAVAAIAFDALRRLLPDTDIYVGANRA